MAIDPADILRTQGGQRLVRLLEETQEFGARLLANMVATANLDDAAARLWLARDAARVIAALPPNHWISHVDQLAQQLDLPPGMLQLDVIDAAEAWSHDPANAARHQIRMLTDPGRPGMRHRMPSHHSTPAPSTPPPAPPTHRAPADGFTSHRAPIIRR